ncbi:unnamed protein product, partial [Owenia fusiformis]
MEECTGIGGAWNGQPSPSHWVKCHFDWCRIDSWGIRPGLVPSRPGFCPAGTRKAYGTMQMPFTSCKNLGGRVNGNPSNEDLTDCHLDWCFTDKSNGFQYVPATIGTCPDDTRTGVGSIEMKGKECRDMGGKSYPKDTPHDAEWTQCNLDWCGLPDEGISGNTSQVIHVETPPDYRAYYVANPTILSGHTYIRLEVMTCRGAMIYLSQSETADLSGVYHVEIGGTNNKKSFIAMGQNGAKKIYVDTPRILKCNEYRQFWVSWMRSGPNMVISAGKGLCPGINSFMTWSDPAPVPISYVGIGSYTVSGGSWKVYRDVAHPDCHQQQGPVYLSPKSHPNQRLGIDYQQRVFFSSTNFHPFYLVTPGLTSENNTVSLESGEYGGSYIRHYNYRLNIEHYDESRNPHIFVNDATFTLRTDQWFPGYYTFESVNFRNYYLKKQNPYPVIGQFDGSAKFKSEASFLLTQECKQTVQGLGYVGSVVETRSGKHCQRWDSQIPHPHSNNDPVNFPDATLDDAANKCRNPDGQPDGPWCYTTDPDQRWEYCDVPLCGGATRPPPTTSPPPSTLPPRTCPSSIGREPTDLPRRGGNWAHLMTENYFPCDGEVFAFDYFRSFPSTMAYISIWRVAPGNAKYTLVKKIALEFAVPGRHYVPVSPPVPIKRYDFIGVHYSKASPQPAIPNSRGNDGTVEASELYSTINAAMFNEDLNEGVTYDMARWSVIESTYALKVLTHGVWKPYPSTTPAPTLPPDPHTECKVTLLGNEYVGKKTRTASGKQCMRWDSQIPHKHTPLEDDQFPDNSVKDASNYCRNPDNEPQGPWCFTTDVNSRWEYCGIPYCDCKVTSMGKEYTGAVSETNTGLTCQRWDSQTPHEHTDNRPERFPEGDLAIVGNKCRNPDEKNDGPWCYTTSSSVRWQYCDINYCDCKRTQLGKGYQGTIWKTISGRTCQRWASQVPHSHGNTDPNKFPDWTLYDASNYCRNPDNEEGGPWCYTTDKDQRWEYCAVPFCDLYPTLQPPPQTTPVTDIDEFTQTSSGCTCYWDKTRKDCACCKPTGCQCHHEYRHRCVACGKAQDCLKNCPKVIGRNPTDLPRRGGNWAHLMTDNRFVCDGYLVAWEYYRSNPIATVYLGIWRAVGSTPGNYTLQAKTALPPAAAGKIWYDVNPPIPVSEGDFIGIHYSKYNPNPAISNSRGKDGVVSDTELFNTINMPLYDEDFKTGDSVDFSKWSSVKSTHALQAHLSAMCPRGWEIHYNRSCYKVFSAWGDRLSHPDAVAKCQSLAPDSRLISIDTQDEVDYIGAELKLRGHNSFFEFWITKWLNLADLGPGKCYIMTNWRRSGNDNRERYHHYIKPCKELRRFICERTMGSPVSPTPTPHPLVKNCKLTKKGQEYMGTKAKTKTAIICQRWDAQTPHKHTKNDPNNFPDKTIADASNYCRNPDGEPLGPWCYTTNPGTRWQYCDVDFCECKSTKKGKEYEGTIAVTNSGKVCQAWSAQSPHKHGNTDASKFPDETLTDASNYCRNPDGEPNGPWCYTTNERTRWEYCSMPFCDDYQPPAETTLPPTTLPPGFCPTSVGREPSDLPLKSDNWAALLVDAVFPCDGDLVGWEYFLSDSEATPVATVWRLVSDKVYKIVWKTPLRNGFQGRRVMNFDKYLSIKKGDMIGLHYQGGSKPGIPSSRGSDGVVGDSELFNAIHFQVFDEFLTEGDEIDLARWSTIRVTYALRALFDGIPNFGSTPTTPVPSPPTFIQGCRTTTLGKEYMGMEHKTREGYVCQRWDSQEPHSHSRTDPTAFPDRTLAEARNYCRNPDGE